MPVWPDAVVDSPSWQCAAGSLDHGEVHQLHAAQTTLGEPGTDNGGYVAICEPHADEWRLPYLSLCRLIRKRTSI